MPEIHDSLHPRTGRPLAYFELLNQGTCPILRANLAKDVGFVQIDHDILWDNSGPFSLGQINSDKLCHAHPIFDFGVKIQSQRSDIGAAKMANKTRYSIILGYDMTYNYDMI